MSTTWTAWTGVTTNPGTTVLGKDGAYVWVDGPPDEQAASFWLPGAQNASSGLGLVVPALLLVLLLIVRRR